MSEASGEFPYLLSPLRAYGRDEQVLGKIGALLHFDEVAAAVASETAVQVLDLAQERRQRRDVIRRMSLQRDRELGLVRTVHLLGEIDEVHGAALFVELAQLLLERRL